MSYFIGKMLMPYFKLILLKKKKKLIVLKLPPFQLRAIKKELIYVFTMKHLQMVL